MRSTKLTLCVLCAFSLCAPALAQQRHGKRNADPAPPPSASGPEFVARSLDAPTQGDVEGNTYTNKFFGMKVSFPAGWFVFNEVGLAEAREREKGVMKPQSAAERQAMEQSVARTFHLLYVKQYLDASPDKPSGVFIVLAELLPVSNMTPAQYVQITKNMLQTRTTIKAEPVGDITTERLAGEEFALLRVNIPLPSGHVAKQEYYATIRRGWALGFILTYEDEEQHATLAQAMQSLTLGKTAK